MLALLSLAGLVISEGGLVVKTSKVVKGKIRGDIFLERKHIQHCHLEFTLRRNQEILDISVITDFYNEIVSNTSVAIGMPSAGELAKLISLRLVREALFGTPEGENCEDVGDSPGEIM